MSKRGLKNEQGSDDVEPTQRIPEEDLDEMADEPESDDEVPQDDEMALDWPEQPDLGWYLGDWDVSPKGKIAICRTFANYLSAQLPKQVEAKPTRYSGAKKKLKY